jgi:hypothetical protein
MTEYVMLWLHTPSSNRQLPSSKLRHIVRISLTAACFCLGVMRGSVSPVLRSICGSFNVSRLLSCHFFAIGYNDYKRIIDKNLAIPIVCCQIAITENILKNIAKMQ